MIFGFSNKKFFIILVSIIILLLLIGGVFLWILVRVSTNQSSDQGIISETWSVKGDTYEIIVDDIGQKFIENKDQGLKVKIPEDWTVEKFEEEIDLLSPEIEFDEYGSISLDSLRNGACGIALKISKGEKLNLEAETYSEWLKNFIIDVQQNPEDEVNQDYDIVEVDNKLGLRQIIKNEESKEIVAIFVEIPINNTVYSFDTGPIFSEKCIQEFNDFLETVSIDK